MTVLIIITLLGSYVLLIWSGLNKPPAEVPSFASRWPLLGSLQSLTRGREMLLSVYQRQIVDNLPYALPGLFGSCVILPPSMLPWLISQPESLLSAKHAQLDALNIGTTFLRPEIGEEPHHEPVVRRELIAHLDEVDASMWDEVGTALRELWGEDPWKGWKDVNLDYTVRRIVARASNRILVGRELCRDKVFIESAISYVRRVGMYGMLLSLLPRCLRPFVAPLARLPISNSYTPCEARFLPLLKDLITRLESDSEPLPPQLFATWLIASSRTRFPQESLERTPDFLSRCLMALNFAAVHTSTLTTCNLLLEIFSSSSLVSESLRDEALALSRQWGPEECRRSRLNSMSLLDSALRESMRLWNIAPRVLMRRVMSPKGIVLPSGRVSEGTTVYIADTAEIARQNYDNEKRACGNTKGDVAAAAVETDECFTTWGMGKHACPGRFFAVDLFKMIVVHVLVDYELENLRKRQKIFWIEYNVIPPPAATLKVQRRRAYH